MAQSIARKVGDRSVFLPPPLFFYIENHGGHPFPNTAGAISFSIDGAVRLAPRLFHLHVLIHNIEKSDFRQKRGIAPIPLFDNGLQNIQRNSDGGFCSAPKMI